MYRLCEPPKLYSRMGDPQEIHNLAKVPEHAQVRRSMEADVPAGHDGEQSLCPIPEGSEIPQDQPGEP